MQHGSEAEEDDHLMLVPIADAMNHRRPKDVEWTYDEERAAFKITALHVSESYFSCGFNGRCLTLFPVIFLTDNT